MDELLFDAIARAFTIAGSRRRALIGMFGGTFGLLGVRTGETVAKNCKKIKNKKKRKKCLANTDKRSCTPNCRGRMCGDDGCGGLCGGCGIGQICQRGTCCIPEPPSNTCAGRCGTWANNCGQAVPCLACATGQQCLANGSCARECFGSSGCPGLCGCDTANTEGKRYCGVAVPSCASIPQTCQSTAECPAGQHCHQTPSCGPGGTPENRCVPLCL